MRPVSLAVVCFLLVSILLAYAQTSDWTSSDEQAYLQPLEKSLAYIQTIKVVHVEIPLSTDNAYNPIPSSDGKYIAYVRTGWGRETGSGGFGRSNLVSDVRVMDAKGNLLAKKSLADAFLSAWTQQGGHLICYRDGSYLLLSMDGERLQEQRLPRGTERASFFSGSGTAIWNRRGGEPFSSVLETPHGIIAQHSGWLGELIAPSPNGRYLAIAGGWSQTHLWVYDTELKKWAYMGDVDIHPDPDWDYIKPSWNPWFADSSRLVFFTHKNTVLSIGSPDGKQRTDILVKGPAGLAAPSPDGHLVAYVTFEPRPRKERPDLQFWGGTQVWVVSPSGKPEPRAVTQKSPDETYDLRWLDEHALVYDRVADVPLFKHSRIWRVDVQR